MKLFRRTPKEPFVPSPCVRECTIGREQFCIGCGRTVDEIRVWNESDGFKRRDMSNAAKARIARLRQRRPARQ